MLKTMKINTLSLGFLQTNCYIIVNENSECVIIDPATNFNKIDNYLRSNNLKLKAILLTHGHFDHIGAVNELVKKYDCSIYASKKDKELLQNPLYNGSVNFAREEIKINYPINYVEEEDILISDMKFEVFSTPGHTDGSICYFLRSEKALFTGDFLFEGGIGRCDLYSGSIKKMNESLKLVKTFDYDTVIYPGHGGFSTIKKELQNNPYL